MGIIPNVTLITLMDSFASGKLIYDTAVGLTGTEANTTAKAAKNDETTLAVVPDTDVQADLMPAINLRGTTLAAPNLYQTLGAYSLWWAFDKHLADAASSSSLGLTGVTGLDSYLNNQNIRVSAHVKALGFPLSAAQIMPPAVDMATFLASGPGVGTYTHLSDIDISQYGRAWLQVVVTSSSGIGPTPIQATVTGTQIDSVTQTIRTVTIAAASSVGAAVNIGALGTQADSYDFVTAISITGGTVGDAFQVVSRVERTIPATA